MFPSPFQSTHPLRGATSGQLIKIAALHISIHAPLTGCDDMQQAVTDTKLEISIHAPHAPLAGCDNRERIRLYGVFGISIHAPLAGCDVLTLLGMNGKKRISIHAPLAGCDKIMRAMPEKGEISIHAPLAGCDRSSQPLCLLLLRFQSTHPLRGATPGKTW